MKRDFLFSYYQTPRGKLLKELEASFLKNAIVVSCKQTILQIGGLEWEHEFIDCSFYTNYTILDAKNLGCKAARKIRAKAYNLPLQSNSVDMIILPHILEFDAYRFQTMREIERVLKPEGTVVILSLNPLSVWVRFQSIWDLRFTNTWNPHLISPLRIIDWLRLLNFEVTTISKFNLDSVDTSHFKIANTFSISACAFGIKAIKRRYNLIPLTPVKNFRTRFAVATCALQIQQAKQND